MYDQVMKRATTPQVDQERGVVMCRNMNLSLWREFKIAAKSQGKTLPGALEELIRRFLGKS